MSNSPAHAENLSPIKTTVQLPPLAPPHQLLRSLPPLTHFPADLLDLLNQTYFLHLLANDPSKVLPPGKSLLSVLSRPNVRQKRDDEPPRLQDKVEEMIHKAFWDEVLRYSRAYSLSSPPFLLGPWRPLLQRAFYPAPPSQTPTQ
jgi:hypothetical protein